MKTISAAGFMLLLAGCASTATPSSEASADDLTATSSGHLPADYESRTAAQKLDVLWNDNLLATQNATPPAWAGVDLFKLLNVDLNVTVDRVSDEMPAGREKLVHSRGSVAQVEFIADANTPYTGMYKGGMGVARLSLAKDPGVDSFIPGFAMKLLVDGQPSANMEVMLSIDGQGTDFDFFSHTFSNIIPDAVGIGSKIIVGIFSKVSATPGHLDVSAFATHDRHGTAVAAPAAPEQVFFVPAPSVRAVPRSNSPSVDFRDDLAAIPNGSTLYDVLASRTVGEQPVHIGKVLTRSEIISSQFGDEGLFFKHEKHAE